MKLLLVADLHYTLRQWDWLGPAAERFDLVIVAGDLLDIGSIVPLDTQIVVTRKYLHRLAAKNTLLVSSGNHDVLSPTQGTEKSAAWLQQERGPQLHVDGDHFTHGDLFFSILPWWDGPLTQKNIHRQLVAQAPLAKGKRWVWIYHPPPRSTAVSWDGKNDFGDELLGGWIRHYQPEMVLGGHIHNAPFVKDGSWIDSVDGCWVFNGGRQPGGVPTFTVIDTDKQHATWIANEDAGQAILREPLTREPLDD